MSDNETSLIAARADREERDFTQTLRREQDAAYLESLKADQEKVNVQRCNRELLLLSREKEGVAVQSFAQMLVCHFCVACKV